MSDSARKDLSTQAQEKLTPESQKGPADKAGEAVSNAGDSVAAAVQPGDSKSTTQKLSDTSQSGGQGYVEQAQNAASNAAQAVADTATNLYNSMTGEKK